MKYFFSYQIINKHTNAKLECGDGFVEERPDHNAQALYQQVKTTMLNLYVKDHPNMGIECSVHLLAFNPVH